MNNERIEILTKRVFNGLLTTGKAEMSLSDNDKILFEGTISLNDDGIAFEKCHPESSIQFVADFHEHLESKFKELSSYVEQSKSAS